MNKFRIFVVCVAFSSVILFSVCMFTTKWISLKQNNETYHIGLTMHCLQNNGTCYNNNINNNNLVWLNDFNFDVIKIISLVAFCLHFVGMVTCYFVSKTRFCRLILSTLTCIYLTITACEVYLATDLYITTRGSKFDYGFEYCYFLCFLPIFLCLILTFLTTFKCYENIKKCKHISNHSSQIDIAVISNIKAKELNANNLILSNTSNFIINRFLYDVESPNNNDLYDGDGY